MDATVAATLNVTSASIDGTGPGLAELVGTLSGAASGQFTAPQCARLYIPCI